MNEMGKEREKLVDDYSNLLLICGQIRKNINEDNIREDLVNEIHKFLKKIDEKIADIDKGGDK